MQTGIDSAAAMTGQCPALAAISQGMHPESVRIGAAGMALSRVSTQQQLGKSRKGVWWTDGRKENLFIVANAMATRKRRRMKGGPNEGLTQSRDDAVQRRMPAFHEGADGPPLRVLPIGGLGEIGMNCMLVGNYDRYIMIDAGLMFPDFDELGVQKVLPDTTFIRRWRDKIEALIITHGHEDHIGALPWVIPALDPKTPIYATGFTMQLIKSRLKEYNIPSEGRCRTFEMKKRFNAGPFEIEPIRVTHSIPDCCGLVLRCQDGSILHTGDWKIDESPVDGNIFDRSTLEQLSKEGLTLMMSDSTNVLSPGRTTSEADVARALMRRISAAKGRVITTQFASNVHRLGSVREAAEATGRKLVFIGVSLKTYLEAAWRDGQAPFDPSILVKAEDMGAYAPRDLLIVTTGSQAEPRAALNLASYGTSRSLKLNKDDLLLYSAKMIPGNETRVVRMMNRVAELGPTIIQGRGESLHTSGHAYREELEELLRLVKPQHFLPIHGEFAFLKEHELLGKASGIQHTAVIKNGEMLGVSPLRNRRVMSSGFSHLGRDNFKLLYNDGDRAFGTATDLCLNERMQIAIEGIVVASVEVLRDHEDTSDGSPIDKVEEDRGDETEVGLRGRVRITTRCMWLDGGRLLDHMRKSADAALASSPRDSTLAQIERKIATVLRKTAQKYNNKRPEVLVIATESTSSSTGAAASQKSSQDFEYVNKTSVSEVQPSETIRNSPSRTDAESKRSSDALLRGETSTAAQLTNQSNDEENASSTNDTQPSSGQEILPDLKEVGPSQVSMQAADSPAKASTPKRSRKRARKWTQDETRYLISIRSTLASKSTDGQSKSLWLNIAAALKGNGFERAPEQCCSMWGSLMKKYASVSESLQSGETSEKNWPLYDAMDQAVEHGSDKEHSKDEVGAT